MTNNPSRIPMTEYYFDNKRPKVPSKQVLTEVMHDVPDDYEGEYANPDWRNVKNTEKPL